MPSLSERSRTRSLRSSRTRNPRHSPTHDAPTSHLSPPTSPVAQASVPVSYPPPPTSHPSDLDSFSRDVLHRPLRPYQLEPAHAILDSVFHHKGLTFTVMCSRQAGKNELSAQLQAFLLNRFKDTGGNLVKCAPTFNPQVLISKQRLEACLSNHLNASDWRSEFGRSVRLGQATVLFFSADEAAHVVGATAHHLLEVDEAQDVEEDKYLREFRPMGATTNCTTVLYGTASRSDSLLEKQRRANLADEAADRIRRHFEYPWPVVAEHNPAYRRYVEAEIHRLGADHPAIRTQYLLEPLEGGGGFFSDRHRADLRGQHPRQSAPGGPGLVYVAGVDVAGPDEQAQDTALRALKPRKDSTVVTICEVTWLPTLDALSQASLLPLSPTLDAVGHTSFLPLSPALDAVGHASLLPLSPAHGGEGRGEGALTPLASFLLEPTLKVVQLYWWTGLRHRELYGRLVRLLRDDWRCARVAVDATGLGAGLAEFLTAALGRQVVEPITFTAPRKSELGYALLAAVNGLRLTMYAADGRDAEAQAFWAEVEAARSSIGANQRLNFYVPPEQGHDDFIVSLALAVEAAAGARPRVAVGRRAPP